MRFVCVHVPTWNLTFRQARACLWGPAGVAQIRGPIRNK